MKNRKIKLRVMLLVISVKIAFMQESNFSLSGSFRSCFVLFLQWLWHFVVVVFFCFSLVSLKSPTLNVLLVSERQYLNISAYNFCCRHSFNVTILQKTRSLNLTFFQGRTTRTLLWIWNLPYFWDLHRSTDDFLPSFLPSFLPGEKHPIVSDHTNTLGLRRWLNAPRKCQYLMVWSGVTLNNHPINLFLRFEPLQNLLCRIKGGIQAFYSPPHASCKVSHAGSYIQDIPRPPPGGVDYRAYRTTQANKQRRFFPPSYESRTAGSTCLHLNLALRVVILAPAPGLTHSLAPSSERMFSGGLMETHSFLNRAEIHFGPCGGKIPPPAEFFLLMQRSHTCSLWDHISPELRNTHTKININIDANDSFKTWTTEHSWKKVAHV